MHALDAAILIARQPIPPHAPHLFRPRKHGSREACEICGARRDDKIHIDRSRPGDG